jgi:hypothetical protein
MADDQSPRWKKDEMERAAEERLRDLENPESDGRPDPGTGAFNPVEGVPPHGAGIPEKKD